MYPTIYSVRTRSGTRLYYGDNRYDADKALFAANESAQLWVKDSPEPGRVIADNHDVFPPEPVPQSPWIPVTSRLPEKSKNHPWRTDHVLVTDGTHRFIAGYFWEEQRWNDDHDLWVDDITHRTPLPPLP